MPLQQFTYHSQIKGELILSQATAQAVLEVADDPRLSRETKAFLALLNSGDAPPLETLRPLEARQVLANAHR